MLSYRNNAFAFLALLQDRKKAEYPRFKVTSMVIGIGVHFPHLHSGDRAVGAHWPVSPASAAGSGLSISLVRRLDPQRKRIALQGKGPTARRYWQAGLKTTGSSHTGLPPSNLLTKCYPSLQALRNSVAVTFKVSVSGESTFHTTVQTLRLRSAAHIPIQFPCLPRLVQISWHFLSLDRKSTYY